MTPAWRRRCPRGHTSIRNRTSDAYFCEPCETHYSGKPLDAAEHDFPLSDVEERECGSTPHKYAVLSELIQRCDASASGLKASTLSMNTMSAAASLAQLHKHGMVAKDERAHAARWSPTAKGRRIVNGGRA